MNIGIMLVRGELKKRVKTGNSWFSKKESSENIFFFTNEMSDYRWEFIRLIDEDECWAVRKFNEMTGKYDDFVQPLAVISFVK